MKKIILLTIVAIINYSCKKETQKELQLNSEACHDVIINNNTEDVNYFSEPTLNLYALNSPESKSVNRILINFDGIPRNVIIDSAFLSFKYNLNSGNNLEHYGENQFVVSRIISPWNELEVKWSSQPILSPFNKIYCSKTVLDNNPKRINLTKMLQETSDDFDNSYGFQLAFINEEQNALLKLASSDNKDKDLKPNLHIYYRERQR